MRGRGALGSVARSCVAALAVASLAVIAASSSVASAQQPSPADAGAAPPALPACIAVSTESRYVPYGYNHIVIIKNGCSKAATCSVATDVNPQPTSVDVAAGASTEVLTFAGSPAQTFVARVTCKLH